MLQPLCSPRTPPQDEGPPGFSCVRSRTVGAERVTLAGELDLFRVPELDSALRKAAADGGLVVVDLRRLEFIDCAGLHLLIRADRRIRWSGGRLIVVRGGEMIRWLFGLVGADDELELVDRPPDTARRNGHGQATVDMLKRYYGDANETQARLSSAARLLATTTAERDELLSRVGALEQELLDLVHQPPAQISARALQEARPA